MSILCIYHRDCLDGFAAAWVVHRAFPDKKRNMVEYWPTTYGEAPPKPEFIRHKELLIVDFSYPADTLRIMGEDAHSIIVLDHHEKAEKELRNLRKLEFSFAEFNSDKYPPGIHIRFDMEQSGAGLTWRWIHGEDKVFSKVSGYHYPRAEPDLVKYIEDRDLWRFKYDETKAFCAAVGAQPFSFDLWDRFCDNGMRKQLIATGDILLQSQEKMIEQALKIDNMQLFNIGGIEVPTYNISEWSGIVSEALNALAIKYPEWPFVASYHDYNGGRKFSLRSDKNNPNAANVNLIANKYGGGGHPNASGFRVPRGWMGDAPPLPTKLEVL